MWTLLSGTDRKGRGDYRGDGDPVHQKCGGGRGSDIWDVKRYILDSAFKNL